MKASQGIALSQSASENDKRKRIRNYFQKLKIKWQIILIILSFFFLPHSSTLGMGVIFLMIGGAWLFIEIKRMMDAPGDQTIDSWLLDDIENLKKRSLQRLNIDESELIRDSIVIRGPILWSVYGILNKELKWKKGKDKYIRFSLNAVTIIHLTEHKLSSYKCDYNFMRGVPVNERDDEFYYRDVVAVSTGDDATNYTLPNGFIMKQAQFFKLAVAGGDNIQVVVDSSDLVKFTGGAMLDTGLDDAIKALRKVLSEKKI